MALDTRVSEFSSSFGIQDFAILNIVGQANTPAVDIILHWMTCTASVCSYLMLRPCSFAF